MDVPHPPRVTRGSQLGGSSPDPVHGVRKRGCAAACRELGEAVPGDLQRSVPGHTGMWVSPGMPAPLGVSPLRKPEFLSENKILDSDLFTVASLWPL